MISSKTSVSFGGSRNIELDSGLEVLSAAVRYFFNLTCKSWPYSAKKIIKFVGDNGRFSRNHVIYFKGGEWLAVQLVWQH